MSRFEQPTRQRTARDLAKTLRVKTIPDESHALAHIQASGDVGIDSNMVAGYMDLGYEPIHTYAGGVFVAIKKDEAAEYETAMQKVSDKRLRPDRVDLSTGRADSPGFSQISSYNVDPKSLASGSSAEDDDE